MPVRRMKPQTPVPETLRPSAEDAHPGGLWALVPLFHNVSDRSAGGQSLEIHIEQAISVEVDFCPVLTLNEAIVRAFDDPEDLPTGTRFMNLDLPTLASSVIFQTPAGTPEGLVEGHLDVLGRACNLGGLRTPDCPCLPKRGFDLWLVTDDDVLSRNRQVDRHMVGIAPNPVPRTLDRNVTPEEVGAELPEFFHMPVHRLMDCR